jgi:hypothetical protein
MGTIQKIFAFVALCWGFTWLSLGAQTVSPLPAPLDPAVEAQVIAAKAARASGGTTQLAPEPTHTSNANSVGTKSPAEISTAAASPSASKAVKPEQEPVAKTVDRTDEARMKVKNPVTIVETVDAEAPATSAPVLRKTGDPAADEAAYGAAKDAYYRALKPAPVVESSKAPIVEDEHIARQGILAEEQRLIAEEKAKEAAELAAKKAALKSDNN